MPELIAPGPPRFPPPGGASVATEGLAPSLVDEHGEFIAHAEHFANAGAERRAAQLGMWLFLVQEVLLFGGLFTAFAMYRYLYVDTFRYLAAMHLDWVLGMVNTLLLLVSSFTVAAGVLFGRLKNGRMVAVCFAASILFAGAFLVVKYFEYSHKFHVGLLPGKLFTFDLASDIKSARTEHAELLSKLHGLDLGAVGPGAPMFFVLYFFITGLHGIHVVVGMFLLGWIAWRGWRGEFSRRNDTPVELVGMYWHLVDMIWIFVFPALYLL
jgi:cytochrome c oxidase subunit 3